MYCTSHNRRDRVSLLAWHRVAGDHRSFYQAWLTNHPIEPLNHLLEFSGANGQPVPYKGYIEIPITFPEDMVGSEIEIVTLVLIVPDFNPEKQSQVLIPTPSIPCMLNVLTWITLNPFSAIWIQCSAKNPWTTTQSEYQWMPWASEATKQGSGARSSEADSCSLWESKYKLLTG